jgi:hypothetical protein
MSKRNIRKNRREVEPSLGDIVRSLKEVIIGVDEDFEDDFEDDFEETEEVEEVHESPNPTQKLTPVPEVVPAPIQEPTSESAPVQKQVSEPTPTTVQDPAPAQPAETAIWKTLRADLNRFVQSGEASDFLFQLLEEGFEKNPKLLLKIAELVESRNIEEKMHPGFLMVFQGKQSMLTSRERAFELFTQRPGSTIKETVFVSKIRNGKAVETREASEEEKRLYYEQQSSKADASGQKDQD